MRKIEEIRAGAADATPGPWGISIYASDGKGASIESGPNFSHEPVIDGGSCGTVMPVGVLTNTDARFIAHARQDIPDLLDALEAKDEDIQGLETVLSAGQMIVCQQNATIGNLHEDLAEKDAEIEELQNNMLLLAQECLDSTEDLLQADLARVETSIDKIVSDM